MRRLLKGLAKGRRSRVADQLRTPANRDSFWQDATAWDLLQPVAAAIMSSSLAARDPSGRTPAVVACGQLASSVVALARAKDPRSWTCCEVCNEPDEGRSERGPCGGAGYRIVPRDDATIARMLEPTTAVARTDRGLAE